MRGPASAATQQHRRVSRPSLGSPRVPVRRRRTGRGHLTRGECVKPKTEFDPRTYALKVNKEARFKNTVTPLLAPLNPLRRLFFGARDGNRTHYLRFTRALLYQMSYPGVAQHYPSIAVVRQCQCLRSEIARAVMIDVVDDLCHRPRRPDLDG